MDFILETLRNPKSTGAIAPSSKRLVNLILKEADLENAKVVVELGPGTGVFTEKILENLKGDTKFYAIETNKSFSDSLKEQFPEVVFHHGSAEDIKKYLGTHSISYCDRIISGLPWTAFSVEVQRRLLSKIYDSLEPGGIFVTFSYYPFNHLPRGKGFKNLLSEYFSDVYRTEIVSNIPPAFVYVCRK